MHIPASDAERSGANVCDDAASLFSQVLSLFVPYWLTQTNLLQQILFVTCSTISPRFNDTRKNSLVSVRTRAATLVVFGAVNIWAVVEGPIPSAYGPAAPLVQEVPVETGERTMLRAFVLNEKGALLRPELLQISEGRKEEWNYRCHMTQQRRYTSEQPFKVTTRMFHSSDSCHSTRKQCVFFS